MTTESSLFRRFLSVPVFAWLLLFFFVPLAIVVLISFMAQETAPGLPVRMEFTLSQYARIRDPVLLRIFLRTLLIAATTTVLCLLVGYPLALFIVRRPPRQRQLLHLLVIIPFWTNSLILTYSWMILLRVNGLLDSLAQWAGWIPPEESLFLLNTPGAVIAGLLYWYLPFMVYPVYASLEKFDWTLVDAAHDLGASYVQAFRRVILPLTAPGVIAGCLLVFIPALGNFVVPKLLGGGKRSLIGNVIQERFLSQPQNWPLGSAIAIVMMIIVSAALWLYYRVAARDLAQAAPKLAGVSAEGERP
jgi:spermidine/putrescine transport system permease protein